MKLHLCLPLLTILALAGCGVPSSSLAYFEHRESTPFTGKSMSVEVSRQIFEAHLELRDGPLLIVPDVRSLAWEADHRTTVHFFAKSPLQIEIDRIEITSGDRRNTAVLKIKRTTRLSKIPQEPGLFGGEVTTLLGIAEGASSVLAKSPVEMVIYYRSASSGKLLQKRFALKRSIKLGQTMSDIFAAA